MTAVALSEVAGFEMLEGDVKTKKLNKKIEDDFVKEIIMDVKERIDIKWKFRNGFWDTKKSVNCEKLSGE